MTVAAKIAIIMIEIAGFVAIISSVMGKDKLTEVAYSFMIAVYTAVVIVATILC